MEEKRVRGCLSVLGERRNEGSKKGKKTEGREEKRKKHSRFKKKL